MESSKGRKSLASMYLAALVAPAVIAGVMQVSWPFFQDDPISPYLLAVVFCSWFGGLRPGLLSILISFLVADYFFIEPYFRFWLPTPTYMVRLIVFATSAPFIAVMSELMHRERRRAEANLEVADSAREALSKAAAIVESSDDAIIGKTLDGIITSWNKGAAGIYGYSAEEVIGRPISILIPPDHADDLPEILNKVKRGELIAHYETLRISKDETPIYVSLSVSPIKDAGGTIVGAAAIARDITARKQAEAQLRVTTEQLRALSARIQSAKEEEGSRIGREVHDELGSALTILRWDLESFDKAILETGDQSQLQVLRERIETMLRVIQTTIETVRRISSELRPSVLHDLGLWPAIEWQAQQFQDRTGLICQCNCAVTNLDLSGEQSTAVFRIFQEALTNILRHAQATMVNIHMNEDDGELILTISDNGRGITEDERSRSQSLGLLGMQERAHLTGGNIDITGVDGKGTVVTVRISVSGQKESSKHGSRTRVAGGKETRPILIPTEPSGMDSTLPHSKDSLERL